MIYKKSILENFLGAKLGRDLPTCKKINLWNNFRIMLHFRFLFVISKNPEKPLPESVSQYAAAHYEFAKRTRNADIKERGQNLNVNRK